MNFPWGALCVNIVGSVATGLLARWLALRGEGGQMLRLFLPRKSPHAPLIVNDIEGCIEEVAGTRREKTQIE